MNCNKGQINKDNILKPGDIAVVEEDSSPADLWLIGRIVEVSAGEEGVMLTVSLQTKRDLVQRPAVKLSVQFEFSSYQSAFSGYVSSTGA